MNSTPNPLLVTEKEIEKIIQDLLVAKYPNNPPNFEGNEIAKTKLIDLMVKERIDEVEKFDLTEDNEGFPLDHTAYIYRGHRITQLNTYRDGGGNG